MNNEHFLRLNYKKGWQITFQENHTFYRGPLKVEVLDGIAVARGPDGIIKTGLIAKQEYTSWPAGSVGSKYLYGTQYKLLLPDLPVQPVVELWAATNGLRSLNLRIGDKKVLGFCKKKGPKGSGIGSFLWPVSWTLEKDLAEA